MAEENTNKGIDIASNNKLGSDNTVKISLFNIENDFSGLANAVSCFFPSMRYEMLLRYRAETIAKIGIEAYKIAQNENVQTNPIPPKIALPLIEKMSLEHEPDMYEKWAKLLVATSVNPNPIHQQYADILSNLDYNCANFLKTTFIEQIKKQNTEPRYDDYVEKSMFNDFFNDLNMRYSNPFLTQSENELSDSKNFYNYTSLFTFPMILYGTEESVVTHWVLRTEKNKNEKINIKDHQSPCLSISVNNKKMLQLLVKLGLIKYRELSYDRSNDNKRKYIERYGIILTEFGETFIDCLEYPNGHNNYSQEKI